MSANQGKLVGLEQAIIRRLKSARKIRGVAYRSAVIRNLADVRRRLAVVRFDPSI